MDLDRGSREREFGSAGRDGVEAAAGPVAMFVFVETAGAGDN
jgi:hypothetical protein